jgi:hypothetical protein
VVKVYFQQFLKLIYNKPKDNMEQTQKKRHLMIAGVSGVALLVVAGLLIWLYTGEVSGAKASLFRAIPLPAAFVGSMPVPASEVLDRVALTEKLGADSSEAYDLVLDGKKIARLAGSKSLSVSNAEIDEEYNNIIAQFAGGDAEAFRKQLTDTYNMNEAEFKDSVIRQSLLEAQLATWFHQQENLNSKAYEKARELQSKLGRGENFDDVAKTYTEDEASKDFAGTSEVMPFDELLPEFRTGLQDNKTDDVKMIASRYGLHILKVLDNNNNSESGQRQIRLQQIFVQGEDFAKWLEDETAGTKVTKLLKFS